MVFLGAFRTLLARRIVVDGKEIPGRIRNGNVLSPEKTLKKAFYLRMTRGFYGRTAFIYKFAIRAAHKAMHYATKHRYQKKLEIANLWTTRLTGACAEHGMDYQSFMSALAEADVQLNRKVLTDLAIHEPKSFQCLVMFAKQRIKDKGLYNTPVTVPEGIMTKSMAERIDRKAQRKKEREVKHKFE